MHQIDHFPLMNIFLRGFENNCLELTNLSRVDLTLSSKKTVKYWKSAFNHEKKIKKICKNERSPSPDEQISFWETLLLISSNWIPILFLLLTSLNQIPADSQRNWDISSLSPYLAQPTSANPEWRFPQGSVWRGERTGAKTRRSKRGRRWCRRLSSRELIKASLFLSLWSLG